MALEDSIPKPEELYTSEDDSTDQEDGEESPPDRDQYQ